LDPEGVKILGNVVFRRKPQSTFCECEAVVSLRHTYLGFFLLDSDDITKLIMGAIWNFAKGIGLH